MSRWICPACGEENKAERTRCNNCDAPKPASQEEPAAPRWEVIGGADKGGILVRVGQELSSPQEGSRLSTGAIIEEKAINGERLNYRLLSGTGPSEGWISIRLKDKELARRVAVSVASAKSQSAPKPGVGSAADESPQKGKDDNPEKEEAEWSAWSLGKASGDNPDRVKQASAKKIMDAKGKPYEVLGLAPGASSSNVRRAYHMLALLHHPDKGGDELVFKTISDAYKVLTDAKDAETGGWRDLENQAVGPWPGHPDMGTKGVTAMLFDNFGAPPWESRRLYTGGYLEGNIKCWELSKGEPGKVQPPPRLVGEISVGGFINDIAALSSFGLLSAQSAGMKPMEGESLRCWNLKTTPFKPVKADIKAIGGRGKKQVALTSGETGSEALAVKEDEEELEDDALARAQQDGDGYLAKSEMVYLHYRGVRVISLWPKPVHRESIPVYAATVSKDWLAVSKIRADGLGLEDPGGVFKVMDPHQLTDVNCMQHETAERIWSGCNGGIVKCWDIARSGKDAESMKIETSSGWISGIVMWPDAGCLCCSHTSGMVFIDMRAGKQIRQQYTNFPVGKICHSDPSSPYLFAGVGGTLNQYDTRMWKDGISYKPKAVGQWDLGQPISSLASTVTGKGHLLIAVGCLYGRLAAFDTT